MKGYVRLSDVKDFNTIHKIDSEGYHYAGVKVINVKMSYCILDEEDEDDVYRNVLMRDLYLEIKDTEFDFTYDVAFDTDLSVEYINQFVLDQLIDEVDAFDEAQDIESFEVFVLVD